MDKQQLYHELYTIQTLKLNAECNIREEQKVYEILSIQERNKIQQILEEFGEFNTKEY